MVMAKKQQQPETTEPDNEPLDPKNLDKYIAATAKVVAELRDFLRDHHDDLINFKIELDKSPKGGGFSGLSVEPTKASADPQYAAEIRRLEIASDSYLNTLRGVR